MDWLLLLSSVVFFAFGYLAGRGPWKLVREKIDPHSGREEPRFLPAGISRLGPPHREN